MFRQSLEKLPLCLTLIFLAPFAVGDSGESSGADEVRVTVVDDSGAVIDRGLALARETEFRDSGFGDVVATGTIVNTLENGSSNRRVFEMVTVEMTDDGDRRFVRVAEPASMRGTLFLSHAHALVADDIWVQLPRTQRLRRISAQDKTGRFLNSELTLEDISPWEVDKYRYRYLREEPCGDGGEHRCHVIENTPAYAHSGYSYQLEWLDTEIYQPRLIEYYDVNGKLIKTLVFSDYRQFAGKHWRPMFMRMNNVQTQASSDIFWDDYQVGTGYSPDQLSPTNIARLKRQ